MPIEWSPRRSPASGERRDNRRDSTVVSENFEGQGFGRLFGSLHPIFAVIPLGEKHLSVWVHFRACIKQEKLPSWTLKQISVREFTLVMGCYATKIVPSLTDCSRA